jgi:hypothetical protein
MYPHQSLVLNISKSCFIYFYTIRIKASLQQHSIERMDLINAPILAYCTVQQLNRWLQQ